MAVEQDAVDNQVEDDLTTDNEPADELADFLIHEGGEGDEVEASEEDASEDDAEDSGDEAEDEDDAEEDEDAEDELFEVTLERDDDGNPVKGTVTREELIAGYQRNKDYTQKTMAAAEERKAAEAAREAATQAREEYMANLAQWAIQPNQEPDWALAAQQLDPQQFNLARVQWEQQVKQSEAAKAEYRRLQADIKAEQDAETARRRDAALERLYAAYPEWRDPKVAQSAAKEIAATAKDYGFSEDEVSEFVDDRVVRLLRDAAKLKQIETNTATMEKRKFEPGKTLRPGAKTSAKQKSSQKAKEATERLRNTKSKDAFVDWLLT